MFFIWILYMPQNNNTKVNNSQSISPKLPLDIRLPQERLYNSEKLSALFDNTAFLSVFTLGACFRLEDALNDDIPMTANVLQFGATFGPQIEKTAYKISTFGKYVIVDNNPKQIKRCDQKYQYLFPQLSFIKADATRFKSEEKFDRVICYNLLHELPPLSKIRVVDNALNLIKTGGKVIFIDYHNPSKWNPFRYFIRMFNRLYQPFAEKLWERSIDMYATKKAGYSWRKTTYYGGMYQKVVVTKIGLPK